ncbi:MAG: SDR family oxidoreductase [Verrucomicrobiales bacterium]|nr:SDR family oxidoreductase [Verrucomicrobiales bacterium]MBP9225278.1 SDR family oxidoreductase [Verrucomicrobiales bacterium]
MRDPSKAGSLAELDHLEVVQLDVTDQANIAKAVNKTLGKFGNLDVLPNNAGYDPAGLHGRATVLSSRSRGRPPLPSVSP